MEIIITKIINRLDLIKYINIIDQCGLKEAKRKVDAISNGIKQSIDIPDKYLTQFKTICEFTIESKRYNMEKHQFKPFEHVLVRYDGQSEWTTGIYSRIGKNCMNETVHVCAGGGLPYKECIPYNEETAHLLGTTKPYKEPEPKVWHVINPSGSFDKMYTAKELSNFIETEVINNKDITNFHVTYINPND